MKIIEYFLNEEIETIHIKFSTASDGDDYYRTIDLPLETFEYYSPTIINDLEEIDEDILLDTLKAYFLDNDLPRETIL